MTIIRYLPAAVLVAATVGTAAGQTNLRPYTPPGRTSSVVPSVLPGGGGDEVAAQPGRPTIGENGLDRLTKTQSPPTNGNPVGTLTGQPADGPRELPPGAVASPWYTDGPGCCGPMGANGRVAYDVYTRVGWTTPFGSGEFTDRLHSGIHVAGGGRTLFFDRDHEAAWVVDLGFSFQHNRGKLAYPLPLFVKQPPQTDQFTGQVTPRADAFIDVRIRGLTRTTFNFAVGRDWWLFGPGSPGNASDWNVRVGADIGGRWGTAHVDLLREDNNDFYFRRQGVTHGFTFGTHLSWEKPMGGWILFGGVRAEYGHDWTNIVPPIKGDVQDVNLLLTGGVRF